MGHTFCGVTANETKIINSEAGGVRLICMCQCNQHATSSCRKLKKELKASLKMQDGLLWYSYLASLFLWLRRFGLYSSVWILSSEWLRIQINPQVFQSPKGHPDRSWFAHHPSLCPFGGWLLELIEDCSCNILTYLSYVSQLYPLFSLVVAQSLASKLNLGYAYFLSPTYSSPIIGRLSVVCGDVITSSLHTSCVNSL